jgi:hypothetical protein
MIGVRGEPCRSCPYRRDVPSGIWAHSEYDKLRDYDAPTAEQPWRPFGCHVSPDHFCHGWVAVHQSRGPAPGGHPGSHPFDLLALRVWQSVHGPVTWRESSVEFFASAAEAADHGQRDIEHPSDEAVDRVAELLRKYPRLEGS